MKWITRLPWDLIRDAANEYGVPARLVGAIVSVESSGVRTATRFEPKYKYFYKVKDHASALGITVDTETMHQQTSFGLMQIMGSSARELGFQEHLVRLCESELGLKYGCLYVKKLAGKYTERNDIIASYNAGSPVKNTKGLYVNQAYVDNINARLSDLDKLGV